MKTNYKYFASAAFSLMFGLLVAFSANAQHRGGGGGGSRGGGGFSGGHSSGGFSGGGSRGGGGFSGGSFSRGGSGGSFSRGGGSVQSRPSGGFGSFQRPSGGGSYQGRSQAYSSPRVNSVQPGRSYGGSGQRLSYGGRQSYSAVAPQRGYSNGGRLAYGGGSRAFYGGAPRTAYRGGTFHGSYFRGTYQSYNRFYGHYNFYNRLYYPRLGFHLSVLPYGYYPFYWGDYPYYYSDGYYYRYDDNQYTIVEPPVGAILNQLPAGAQSLMIDGEQYYELNGVYYEAVTKDDGTTGYQIAGKDGELSTRASYQQAPPVDGQDDMYDQAPQQPQQETMPAPVRIGDMYDSLPPNTSTVKIDGQKYYITPDGIYYQEDRDGNHKVYRVVGTPDDAPSN